MSQRISIPAWPDAPPRVLLSNRAVNATTARYYREAYEYFAHYCTIRHQTQLSAETPPPTLDRLCDEYITDLFDQYGGHLRHLAERLASGIFQELSRHFRGHLYRYSRGLQAWRRLAPSVSHRPMPWAWVLLVCYHAARHGELSLCRLFLMVFCGYLRGGEGLRLRARDLLVSRNGGGRTPTGMVGLGLRLLSTKTGPNQFAQIREPVVIEYLSGLQRLLHPDARLFDLTSADANAALRRMCTAVGLPADFTLHSLRHGAAAHDYLAGVPPDIIQKRGRWRSAKTVDTYLQCVAALTADLQCPPAPRTLLGQPAAMLQRLQELLRASLSHIERRLRHQTPARQAARGVGRR